MPNTNDLANLHGMNKMDPALGAQVNQYLISKGVETPVVKSTLTSEEKINQIKDHFTGIMEILALDLSDDSLIDTPARVAKMYVNEIFWGLDYNKFPKCTAVENKMKYDEMVLEKNIGVMSQCEHHFVVIDGLANVAYIPNQKVIGISKINRIVEFFSKRPQIQERLTEQIYFALEYILDTDNIAVMVDASHYCVKSRGVRDVLSSTITSKLGGGFKSDPTLRAEFMNLVSKR